MKNLITGVLIVSGYCMVAQPPIPANTDTVLNKTSVYADTTGANKQVPNNTSVLRDNKASTDSTKVRYEKGGKTAKDAQHTKKAPAQKDTPHSNSSARKSEKK